MKIQQISVFLENKPGRTLRVCEVLADAGVDILTLTLADTKDFGVFHLIVRDPAKTKQVLADAGYAVNTTDVIAVEVEDRPGGLASILAVLAEHAVNIAYMYAFTHGADRKAVIIIAFDDPGAALAVLQKAGARTLTLAELGGRAGT